MKFNVFSFKSNGKVYTFKCSYIFAQRYKYIVNNSILKEKAKYI